MSVKNLENSSYSYSSKYLTTKKDKTNFAKGDNLLDYIYIVD